MYFGSLREFYNITIVLSAGVIGGWIHPSELIAFHFTFGDIQTYNAEIYSFLMFALKCIQSVIFALLGYLTKLAFDHFFKDKVFPAKDKLIRAIKEEHDQAQQSQFNSEESK
ncbi:MAG TPA: hypothetical protein VGP47_11345 [Parachlamydiaceae bacterium]|nr:hypothetical protein [Parachlamydiaceae bacterium]